ncbi:serine/threonine protein kinase [Purpureocillium lilacinum]|uniref:Serine/threonine protein kinase n=1 Tax=Purpureocillium lilacinum TaxID=33203 RepID=A0A179H6F2_PURLI|nr:serine/threonine protein kinase [Purpureocillium lilacinum]OAQ85765.1 serine/threonine protein kinase [Purpureocillium lilacinum]
MDDGSHYFPAHICVGADEYLTGSQAEARNLANLESFLQRQDWIQSSGLSSPFAVVYGNGDHSGKNWYYAPEQRLGLINSVETLAVRLDHARSQASAYLKEDVYEATIGVPAHFYNDEQWVVREAAMVAGLNVLNITMNPCGLIETAMDSLKIPRPEATVLALEVGASHFTFALATRENGFVDIREHGSAMVGGKDFRLRIFEHLVWIAVQRGMNPLTNAAATHRLRVASEAAKIALSSSEQYTVSLESLVDGQDFFEIITRETFECLCQDLFLSIMSNLDDMDWKWDIHQRGIYYVLIGGESSRIPKLRRLWEEWLWKRGIGHSTIKFINIGHAGAMGLALNAGAISGMDCQAHAPRVSSLMEVATENIGIETRGGIMSKLILRNSTIPRRSRKQFWWHAEDMCPEVMAPGPDQKQTRSTQTIPSHGALQVYEGHRTRTKDNRRIASIDLTQLFAHATTTNVLLEVAIDIDVRLAIIIEVSIAGTQFRIRETMNTHEETVMKQPKPRSADESEAESSVRGTTLPSGTDSATVASSGLDAFFSSTSMVGAFTDTDFYRVSTYLRNTGNMAWSTAPRLYTVLRVIDQLDAMEVFLRQGINDMWFPFTNRTLPAALQPSIQAQFLDRQEMAYSQSKTFQLESGEQKHAYFSKEDPLPFRVIARLGRGAHGSVDKVMSNFSQREYARKLFRKSRGLRAEDVQAFKTELGILKRVTHRHCVSLVATYSDPKYFALLMEPVGDYNLAEYYTRCRNEPDKHSLMRGFFGCLVSAVQYLHDSKVRHRDIKPQNIIVRSDQVLLADFGIAHSWENLTRATTTADSGKTMTYAAPEVIRVEPRNTAADMWSLGCIFLEIVTVLKAKTTQELRTHFIEHSDTPAFHANTESTQIWAEELRRLAPAGDNAAVGWALDMLQHNQHARPTAASLFEEILRESISCGTLFCGTCCDGVESTEGEEDDEHLWGDDGL